MALSESVTNSLKEAELSLRNALAFAARQERPYVGHKISELIVGIDNLQDIDIMLDTLEEAAEAERRMTSYVGRGTPVFEFILPDECIEEANHTIDNWMESGKESPQGQTLSQDKLTGHCLYLCVRHMPVFVIKMISNLIYNAGGRLYGGLNDGTTDVEYDVKNTWGADYGPGSDYVKPHCHFPADWAAVGYLRVERVLLLC